MPGGKIIRGVGGFYDIHTGDGLIYRCRAKGIFRKLGQKPLVGDDVVFDITHEGDMEGSITELMPRRSRLLRPAVANVDRALIIFSAAFPSPNLNLLDIFLLHMWREDVPCTVCFNKTDLTGDTGEMAEAYGRAGYRVLQVSASLGQGIPELREVLRGHTTTVAGPSGVGKSTIINLLQPHTVMETGEVSERIGRGRHTTRHTELISLDEGTYIMDTPGFTSLMLPQITERELEEFYNEFEPYRGECRFNGCSHTHEPDCSVKRAVEDGLVHSIRYDNYSQLLTMLKNKNFS